MGILDRVRDLADRAEDEVQEHTGIDLDGSGDETDDTGRQSREGDQAQRPQQSSESSSSSSDSGTSTTGSDSSSSSSEDTVDVDTVGGDISADDFQEIDRSKESRGVTNEAEQQFQEKVEEHGGAENIPESELESTSVSATTRPQNKRRTRDQHQKQGQPRKPDHDSTPESRGDQALSRESGSETQDQLRDRMARNRFLNPNPLGQFGRTIERAEQARQQAQQAQQTAQAARERRQELQASDQEAFPVDASKLTEEGRQELGISEDYEGTVTVTKATAVEFLEQQEESAQQRAEQVVDDLFADDEQQEQQGRQSRVQRTLDQIENRGPLDFEDQDLAGQAADVLEGVGEIGTEVADALRQEDADVTGATKDLFTDIAELGTQTMVEGGVFSQDIRDRVEANPEGGVFRGDPDDPSDTPFSAETEEEINRLEAKAVGGLATLGTQGPGFLIAGAGGAGREATEAAESLAAGDVDAVSDQYFELGASGREFAQIMAQEAADDPAGFIAEEGFEEVSEAIVLSAVASPFAAVASAVPTPEIEPEPEPEPEPETEPDAGGATGERTVEVQQGAPPQLVSTQEADITATPADVEPEADRVGELFGIRGEQETEFATEQESLTAVVKDEEGDVEDVFFGSVSSRGTASEGEAEGLADVTAVRVGDDSGVVDVGDLQETLVDFEIETDEANRNSIIRVEGQDGRDIEAEQVLSEFSGRIGEQEIQGRSKELRFTDTEFGEKGFSESSAVDPEDDFIIGFEEFQSAVSSGQRAEGSTRSTIVEEEALQSLEIEDVDPDVDPDTPELDDLSPEEIEDLQATADEIFDTVDQNGNQVDPQPDSGGGSEPGRNPEQAFDTEPEQEPDIAGPVQEAEREAFRQVVEGEIESEPEPEPEPELEAEAEPVVDPENLLRTSFEQDQQLDPVQDDELDVGQEPELGQLQSPEQEPATELEQELDPVQGPVEEPTQELFIDPEPELEPRRSPRPDLDFGENDRGDISPVAEDPLAAGQDAEFAPSLEAVVFNIRGEVDEDEELTGLELRPIDEDAEF